MGYPFEKGIITLYTLIIFILFIISIKNYGMPIYKDAFYGFKNYRSLTMVKIYIEDKNKFKTLYIFLNQETLITLGSVSSILMSFYVFIEYFIINA